MKMINKILLILLSIVIPAVFIYLIGSFAVLSWSVDKWENIGRGLGASASVSITLIFWGHMAEASLKKDSLNNCNKKEGTDGC